MKKLVTTLCVLLLFAGTLFPQVTAVLTIENQQAIGPDFFFDLYLRTSQASDSIFLANADFVLSFDETNFSSLNFAKVGSSPGQCTFVPRISDFLNNLFTRDFYFSQTQLSILNGNRLVINVPGPTPDATTISTRVARIDNQALTHCLGRFRVSTINNPNGSMNMQWVIASTIVTSFDPITLQSDTISIIAVPPTNAPLPVELVSFTASYKNSAVILNWQTKTEVNNYGFNLERRVSDGDWDSIVFIEGHGNTNSPKEYSYTDKDLFAGGSKFQYRLKQIDSDGSFSYSDVVEVEIVPDQYDLSQNYPNPFNPSTTIRFSLPKATQLKLTLYNMLGEQVATLAEGMYESGYHKITFNAGSLPSGTYVYRLESSDFVQVKKMILIK